MEEIESNGVGLLTIEWEMMDKTRFFGLSLMHTVSLRMLLYPLTVIKTRLQVCLLFIWLIPSQIYVLQSFSCKGLGKKRIKEPMMPFEISFAMKAFPVYTKVFCFCYFNGILSLTYFLNL